MANSKRLVLLNHLRDTLLPGITTGAGFNHTVKLAERGVRSLDTLTDDQVPALFVVAADEQRENMDGRVNFQSRMNVAVVGYVKDANGAPGKVQEQVDNLIEDLTKKLYADITQGARCLTTEIRSVTVDAGDLGEYGGFVMEVEFMYAAPTATP